MRNSAQADSSEALPMVLEKLKLQSWLAPSKTSERCPSAEEKAEGKRGKIGAAR